MNAKEKKEMIKNLKKENQIRDYAAYCDAVSFGLHSTDKTPRTFDSWIASHPFWKDAYSTHPWMQ